MISDFSEKLEDSYRCTLCPHNCILSKNKNGVCQVRKYSDDGIVFNSYGKITTICVEPIEKKPIYHYKPNLKTLTIGRAFL